MSLTSGTLAPSVYNLRNNPAALTRLHLDVIQRMSNGEIVALDPTIPFVALMEASAMNTTSAIQEMRLLSNKSHPTAAIETADLYRHMADVDYQDAFASPSIGTFGIAFNWENLVRAAPVDDAFPTTRKLVIPRYTEIFNGTDYFTFQYPLVIRIRSNNAVQVYWEIDQVSPVQSIASSNVPYSQSKINNVPYISFMVDLPQVQVVSREDRNNEMVGFKKTLTYTDQFQGVRAFIKNANQPTWREIKVTHSADTYDPAVATMLVKVNDRTVDVTIPLTYNVNGLVTGEIRVDIYTTRGEVSYVQDVTQSDAFSMVYRDFEIVGTNQLKYTTPLMTLDGLRVYGIGDVSGGRSALSFDQVKSRFIQRSSRNGSMAITPIQVEQVLFDEGFAATWVKDSITDRRFLASRKIPSTINQIDTAVSSGMGVILTFLQRPLDELIGQYGILSSNPNRCTITPKCLFNMGEAGLSIVTEQQITAMKDPQVTPPEVLVGQVNNAQYLFSPFHVRISGSNRTLQVDSYSLERPSINYKHAVYSNLDSEIYISSIAHDVVVKPDGLGYYLYVEVDGGANLRAVPAQYIHLQLGFTPDRGGRRAYLNGTLSSGVTEAGLFALGRIVYRFDIQTQMDIDESHYLYILQGLAVNLTKAFDIVYVVEGYMPPNGNLAVLTGEYDAGQFNGYSPTNTYLGLTKEKIEVKFGERLRHHWQRYRSVPEATRYRLYDEDVVATYDTDIPLRINNVPQFEPDPNGIPGSIRPRYQYRAGDIIVDQNGEPVIQHRAGTPIKVDGQPIPIGGTAGIVRQLEIMLFDGKYYFATDDASRDYVDRCKSLVAGWITNQIARLAREAIAMERTELYFVPKCNIGKVTVIANEGEKVAIDAGQSITVDYYVSGNAPSDVDVIERIYASTADTINLALEQQTISKFEIERRLKIMMGEMIISVSVSGLFNDEFSLVTITDNDLAIGLGRRLALRSNMELRVVDDLSVRFLVHR